MANKASEATHLRNILAQFKRNCEVICELKSMLAEYEKHQPKQWYPYTSTHDRVFLTYIPGYTLLVYDSKLIMFYSLTTSTVYDISNLIGAQPSGHYLRRLKADTKATKTMQFRRI